MALTHSNLKFFRFMILRNCSICLIFLMSPTMQRRLIVQLSSFWILQHLRTSLMIRKFRLYNYDFITNMFSNKKHNKNCL
ncbi:unnamed protein product [Meloidogyne enterolobii]|uniref:Uncharacterized protein n=1 Tax=Meloidogyne enterolobii TaxID=390850 RepID=A0ACB0ZQ57_MELEN